MSDQTNNDGEPNQAGKSNRNDGGGNKRDHRAMSREEKLQKQLDAARQELAAEKQLNDAARQELAAEKQLNDAARQELAMGKQLNEGRYFALIDDVFQGAIRKAKANHGNFKIACRSTGDANCDREFRTGNARLNKKLFDYYKHTKKEAAEADRAGAADDADNSRRSYSYSSNNSEGRKERKKQIDRIWPRGIFGQISDGAVAHIVPASPDNANTFWFITDFLFGYDEKFPKDWETRKKIIHGVKQWVVDEKKGGRKKKKVDNTGIKHAIPNFIRLSSQEKNFDSMPNLVIIPIYTVEEAKKWKGEGYEAIVLIDAEPPVYPDNICEEMQKIAQLKDEEEEEKNNRISSLVQSLSTNLIEEERKESLDKARAEKLKAIARATEFIDSDFIPTATRGEITKAHSLVKAYTNAIVYAQTKLAPKEILGKKLLKNGKEKNIVNVFRNTGIVFETELSQNFDALKVRKICFYHHGNEQGHPAPDPILLATHAANQLQRRRGIQLIAAAEPRDDDDEDDDETNLFHLAQEEFLMYRKSLQQEEIIGTDIEIGADIGIAF